MDRQHTRALVVGSGISGRAAAAFLQQSGYPVTLCAEPARGPSGVYIGGNGVRVLSSLGRADLLDEGVKIAGLDVRSAKGDVLTSDDFLGQHERGAGPIGITREALVAALRRASGSVDERATTPRSIEIAPDGTSANVTGENGVAAYDLVVLAEGPSSTLRSGLFPEISFQKTAQQVLWFVTQVAGEDPRAGRVLGDGATLIHFPIGKAARAVAVVASNEIGGDPSTALRSILGSLGTIGTSLLAGLRPDSLHQTSLVEGLATRWSEGPVVLLGGAAHALHPVIGQGAAMAIEDARALQIAMDGAGSVREALVAFEALRRERVTGVHKAGWDQAGTTARRSSLATSFRGLLHKIIPTLSPEQQLHSLLNGGHDLDVLLSHRPDLAPLSTEARTMLCFLVKIGQVDGRFDEIERTFARASLEETGHHASDDDLTAIEAETRFKATSEIVKPFLGHTPEFREHLIEAGVLLAAASGRITSDEHKALREASQCLEIPRETLDRLVKTAIEAPDRS